MKKLLKYITSEYGIPSHHICNFIHKFLSKISDSFNETDAKKYTPWL